MILKGLHTLVICLIFGGICDAANEESPFVFKDALPVEVTSLINTNRPSFTQKKEVSAKLQEEIFKEVFSPNRTLKSGAVSISQRMYVDGKMRKSRQPLIRSKIIFDKHSTTPFWVHSIDAHQSQSVFIRNDKECLYWEKIVGSRPNSWKIHRKNLNWHPETKYCEEFPLFTIIYSSHQFMHAERLASFTKSMFLSRKFTNSEKVDDSYLFHFVESNKITNSNHDRFQIVLKTSAEKPYHFEKFVIWHHLTEVDKWVVKMAWQTTTKENNGAIVPTHYVSYSLRSNNEHDAKVIKFKWSDVNSKIAPTFFSSDLFETNNKLLEIDFDEYFNKM